MNRDLSRWGDIFWQPQRDLNPCFRNENPTSLTELDDGALNGAERGTWTLIGLLPLGPQPSASANSATSAFNCQKLSRYFSCYNPPGCQIAWRSFNTRLSFVKSGWDAWTWTRNGWSRVSCVTITLHPKKNPKLMWTNIILYQIIFKRAFLGLFAYFRPGIAQRYDPVKNRVSRRRAVGISEKIA